MISANLFKLLFGSYLKQEKLRVLFTTVSIILGVSLYVSTRLTTENILTGFDAATTLISQKNVIRITSESGSVSENIIPKLLNIPEVDTITPISTQFVQTYSGNQSLGYAHIIGVDALAVSQIIPIDKQEYNFDDLSKYLGFFLDQPIQAFVSNMLANKVQNSPFTVLVDGLYRPIKIQATFNDIDKTTANDDYLIIIDIKNFQNLFNTYQYVDQLNLTFNTEDAKLAMEKVAHILPKQLNIHQGNDNSNYAEDITSTLRFNLNLIIWLTLLVTAIIIYNSISYFMLDRRRDFGITLMLGAQPKTLFLSSLLASLLFTTLCAAIGILIGYLITLLSIHHITQTFSTLFLPVSVTEVQLPMHIINEVLFLVFIMTCSVSILPCLEIYHIPLRQTVFYQTYEEQFQSKITKTTLIGASILLISFIGLIPFILKSNTLFAYLSISGILLSSAFFLPSILVNFLMLVRMLAGKVKIEAIIAVEHIKATMRKHTVAISVMSIAISLYLSAMIVIDSTQQTTTDWVNHVLSADIYIGEKNSTYNFLDHYLPDDFVHYIKTDPHIRAGNFLVHKDINYHEKPLRVIGTTFSTIGSYFKVQFVRPMTNKQLKATISDLNNVFISEHFANQFNLKIGDIINIPGNHGFFNLKIANISYNYSPFQNILLMPNALFTQLYDEPRVQNAMLYLQDPKQYEQVISELTTRFPKLNLLIQYQTGIKKTAENMLSQTFELSKIIVTVILVLTTLTLFNTLEQLILSRRHEFAIFWSLGANDYTLLKMCLWESFIIYSAAVLNAILPTIIILTLIFNYLDKAIFGAEIFLSISYSSIFIFIIMLIVIVLLDGLIPALKARSLLNAEGLRYE